jgi:hypothetical protein
VRPLSIFPLITTNIAESVANATSDLLMMGAWHCALDSIKEDPIPVQSTFA